MPFACAAIVGIALIYFAYLWILQLFSGPRPDLSVSSKPVPPRALSGNGAWPVLGHTPLFWKHGGDLGTLFPPTWREWRWLPCSRLLGEIFSVFIWGKWVVVVQGPERTRQVFESGNLKQAWAWSPPVTILGKNCMPLLAEDERELFREMIEKPLSQASIVKQAPAFAEAAERCLREISQGCFEDGPEKGNQRSDTMKIRQHALRSYTLDIVDGPLLNMHRFENDDNRPHVKRKKRRSSDSQVKKKSEDDQKKKLASREMMITWIRRMKKGLCDIKITYGGNWMQCWRLNWYGRALNARGHLLKIIGEHVDEREQLAPVHHDPGWSARDPLATYLPFLSLTEQLFRSPDSVMGGRRKRDRKDQRASKRDRALSEADLVHDHEESRDVLSELTQLENGSPSPTRHRARAHTEPEWSPMMLDNIAEEGSKNDNKIHFGTAEKQSKKKVQAVLDHILWQEHDDGRGISKAATCDVVLLLWFMMDIGQAWTAMSLHILSKETSFLSEVQREIDGLVGHYGDERLFTSFVLAKMKKLDALIYEAIRVTPEFLGGMKVTQATIELDDEVQIPTGTNVIFSQPRNESIDLKAAEGKRPQDLMSSYPSIDLFGFLPFEGLEIPIMVLQTKVFLIVLLRNYEPVYSNKRTFVRKVHDAVSKSFSVKDEDTVAASSEFNHVATPTAETIPSVDGDSVDLELGSDAKKVARESFQDPLSKLKDKPFTSMPFAEPKRNIRVRRRVK